MRLWKIVIVFTAQAVWQQCWLGSLWLDRTWRRNLHRSWLNPRYWLNLRRSGHGWVVEVGAYDLHLAKSTRQHAVNAMEYGQSHTYKIGRKGVRIFIQQGMTNHGK